MRRLILALALLAPTLTCSRMAEAHPSGLSEGIRFTLKPRSFSLTQEDEGLAERARISRIDPVPVDDRAHELTIMVRRKKLQLLRDGDQSRISALNGRSRLIQLAVQDRTSLGDWGAVSFGFQGIKLTNRAANVTAAGDGRLRTRDWFMPQASIATEPAPGVHLGIGYRETLRAYGDTGLTGPLGLTREAFRSLVAQLRPERHSRLLLDAEWKPSPALALALGAYHGRIDDRLSFADGAYLPFNSGSARLTGMTMTLAHRLSPDLWCSIIYGEADAHRSDGPRAKERSMALKADWVRGRWSASLKGTNSSAPALSGGAEQWRSRIYVEGEMRYRLPSLSGKPASISLRLTDPVPLASAALLRNGPAEPAYAAEQTRGLMLGLGLGW